MKLTKKTLFKAITLLSFSVSANAIDFDWKICASDIEKFCAGEKDNEKIWACLQVHDIDLTTECDNLHSDYEKLTGKIANK